MIRTLLWLCFFFNFSFSILAQNHELVSPLEHPDDVLELNPDLTLGDLKSDTLESEITFSDTLRNTYNLDDFDYNLNLEKVEKQEENNWFWEFLNSIFPDSINTLGMFEIMWGLFKLILFLALLYGLYVLIRYLIENKRKKLLKAEEEYKTEINLNEVDNLEQIDFQKEIKICVENKAFQSAVRLHYLSILQQLNKSKHIDWQSQKTNIDYYYELSGKDLQAPFQKLTFLYNYAWFGKFSISETEFEQIQIPFQNFENQLKKHE